MKRAGGSKKHAFQLRLRAATMADAKFLFRLRNDPTTRANSFSTSEIAFADHRAWLSTRLADPLRRVRLFVAVTVGQDLEEVPIGQVRFDFDGHPDRAEMSIALARSFRGRGLATPLLRRALGYAPAFVERVLARVRVENEISQKAFLKASFRRHGGVRATPAPHVVFVWRRPR
jgi:RimJ/RimL family protein N-acetyltransferase